jgi:hypothetical protein
MGDALAGGHQVELPGPDDLLAAEAVAVQHLDEAESQNSKVVVGTTILSCAL